MQHVNLQNRWRNIKKTISYVQQHNLFVGNLVSLPALQNGGMCYPNTNYFTDNAFTSLAMGHMSMLPLIPHSLFPVPSIDIEGLLAASYLLTFGQSKYTFWLGYNGKYFSVILFHHNFNDLIYIQCKPI